MKSMSETKRKLELELNQLKVENQWLVNNSKKNNIKNTAEDMEREIHDLRLELKAEKEKVSFNTLSNKSTYKQQYLTNYFRLEISLSGRINLQKRIQF